MKITVKEAADIVGGSVIGDPNIVLTNISKIEDARQGDLTFLYLGTYAKHLETTQASAILIKPEFEKPEKELNYIEVENPDKAFQKIIEKFYLPEFKLPGRAKSAVVDPSAKLDPSVTLGENVVIGKNCEIDKNVTIYHNTVIMDNVVIKENCLIFPNVTIRENCEIHENCIIHSGTVIGSDGFGYNPLPEGGYVKIPQIGNVVIEKNVELGSNVSIDRAAIGSTVIGEGVKLDNLVQVAHNVTIDKNTVISAQTGVSGSTKIGKNCIIAGQVGFAGHINIVDNVIIAAQSGISKAISKPGQYFGYPAKEAKKARLLEAHIRNLPNYSDEIKDLKKRIAELEKSITKD